MLTAKLQVCVCTVPSTQTPPNSQPNSAERAAASRHEAHSGDGAPVHVELNLGPAAGRLACHQQWVNCIDMVSRNMWLSGVGAGSGVAAVAAILASFEQHSATRIIRSVFSA